MSGNCETCNICSLSSFESVCDLFFKNGKSGFVAISIISLYSILATAVILIQCVIIIACGFINYISNKKRKYRVTTRDKELPLQEINREIDNELDNKCGYLVREAPDDHQIRTGVTDATYDEVIVEKKNSYLEGTKQDHKKTPSIVGPPSVPIVPPPLASSIPTKTGHQTTTGATDATYDEVIVEKKNSYLEGTKQDHKKTPSVVGPPSVPTVPPPLASSIPMKTGHQTTAGATDATYDEVIVEKKNSYLEGTKQDHKKTPSVVGPPSVPIVPPPLASSIPMKKGHQTTTGATDATYDEVITEKKNSYLEGTKQDHKKTPSVVSPPRVPIVPPPLASSISGAVKATPIKEGPAVYAIINKSNKRKNRSSIHIESPPSPLNGYEDMVLNEAKIQEKKRRRNSAYEDVVRLSTETAGDSTYDKLDHDVSGTIPTPQTLPIIPNYTNNVPNALSQYDTINL